MKLTFTFLLAAVMGTAVGCGRDSRAATPENKPMTWPSNVSGHRWIVVEDWAASDRLRFKDEEFVDDDGSIDGEVYLKLNQFTWYARCNCRWLLYSEEWNTIDKDFNSDVTARSWIEKQFTESRSKRPAAPPKPH